MFVCVCVSLCVDGACVVLVFACSGVYVCLFVSSCWCLFGVMYYWWLFACPCVCVFVFACLFLFIGVCLLF